MAGKPGRTRTRRGTKVYYDPNSVSRCQIEISTVTGNKAHAGRNAKSLKSDRAPLSMKPERIQAPAAAAITGLSLWNIQRMALRGEIPGAAKHGFRWTFNESKLRRWIRHKEAEACRIVETRR